MKVHEFQAKRLLAERGVPVPRGAAAATPEEAAAAAREIGGRVVVKAQIHAGGRGKGTFRGPDGKPVLGPAGDRPLGGVALAGGAEEAETLARRMLDRVLVTRQTGDQGRVVRRVLVEEASDIARELYLALLLDRSTRSLTFIASAEGGMDIEEVAATRPEAIVRVPVDPAAGYSPWIGRKLGAHLGLGERLGPMAQMCGALYRTFVETDASLVEVNPLIETGDGRLVALDAKLGFDDNALFRHPELRELRDPDEEDPLEHEASRHGLNYIKLDGTVGCMVNGAGLAMATMDIVQHEGGAPANFLDVGGGATAGMVAQAFRILLADENVRAVLINIFGGIMRCDVLAEGVVSAAREIGVDVPVVVRLEGTNVERGREILRGSGLQFEVAEGMRDAARRVVAAAGGRR